MAHKITKGDLVLCRYFNTPSRHFYGEAFRATVISVTTEPKPADRHYSVVFTRPGFKFPISIVLHRKEILKVIQL